MQTNIQFYFNDHIPTNNIQYIHSLNQEVDILKPLFKFKKHWIKTNGNKCFEIHIHPDHCEDMLEYFQNQGFELKRDNKNTFLIINKNNRTTYEYITEGNLNDIGCMEVVLGHIFRVYLKWLNLVSLK